MVEITKSSLIEFEEGIAKSFLNAKIKAPIHLSGGNEEALIEIFKRISSDDWVVSTYRSHYHALLKGIPSYWLEREILAGRSMHIMSNEHKFISTSIVGGGASIATGIALALKLQKSQHMVYCFVGDMASKSGTFIESSRYAKNFNLPISFIIEDNGMSVNTPTASAWGDDNLQSNVLCYSYERKYPHSGAGKWVKF
jgi:pyruvate dehydrogenase E1 component alpha subunit